MRPLHVLIAGGGLSGLALAHAMIGDGHTVEVFERDGDLNRKQGYYLNVNGDGGEALRRCLPADLFALYQATSRVADGRAESIVLDSHLRELSSQAHVGPPNEGPDRHTGVHRRTLRQILAARLEPFLRMGSAVESFTQDDGGVTVTLATGERRHGDLLVGADGIRSAVRAALMPDVPVVATGIRGIGVYGRTPLTPDLEAVMPPVLHEGVLMAIDPATGARLLLAEFRPRVPVSEAAARIAPDVQLDPVESYLMVSCSTAPGDVVPPMSAWTGQTPLDLKRSMRTAIDGWHPAATAIVEGLDPESIFMIPFGYLEPRETWAPSRVTLLGDAAHAMLPTLGMGANLALHDAHLLADALRDADGSDLRAAVGHYEEQMRRDAYPILRMTLDHDRHFGGGALANS